MNSENKKKIGSVRASAFSRIEKMHPARMILYLCLSGISVLFLMLLLAFGRAEATALNQLHMPFPKFFSVSTLVLLAGTYPLSRTIRYYRKDKLQKLSRYLGYTLLSGFAFVLSQAGGWYELTKNGIFFQGKPFGSYLYLISALHMLHLLAGVLFLMYFFFKTRFAAADPVRMLFFIRNPFRRLQLSLLNTYWHFMSGVWVVLYLTFLFLL